MSIILNYGSLRGLFRRLHFTSHLSRRVDESRCITKNYKERIYTSLSVLERVKTPFRNFTFSLFFPLVVVFIERLFFDMVFFLT